MLHCQCNGFLGGQRTDEIEWRYSRWWIREETANRVGKQLDNCATDSQQGVTKGFSARRPFAMSSIAHQLILIIRSLLCPPSPWHHSRRSCSIVLCSRTGLVDGPAIDPKYTTSRRVIGLEIVCLDIKWISRCRFSTDGHTPYLFIQPRHGGMYEASSPYRPTPDGGRVSISRYESLLGTQSYNDNGTVSSVCQYASHTQLPQGGEKECHLLGRSKRRQR